MNTQNELKNVVVLLAAYNSEKYILEQIESILLKKYKTFTYISIDYSDDDTLNILSKLVINELRFSVMVKIRSSANFYRLIREISFKTMIT